LSAQHKNILIVNFDAHYDLRPLIDNKWGSSGTPFTQIAQHCKQVGIPFHYLCIGVQKSANTESLFNVAHSLKVETVLAETIHLNGIASTSELLEKALAKHDAVYLTVCMDVFAQSCAPGVSAPQALGLLPWQVLPLLRRISASGKLLTMDCVELSPPFDQDSMTAKLAASLIWEVLMR
jgi:formiminoglutamase